VDAGAEPTMVRNAGGSASKTELNSTRLQAAGVAEAAMKCLKLQ